MTRNAADERVLDDDRAAESIRPARHEWPKHVEKLERESVARTGGPNGRVSLDAFWALVDG